MSHNVFIIFVFVVGLLAMLTMKKELHAFLFLCMHVVVLLLGH